MGELAMFKIKPLTVLIGTSGLLMVSNVSIDVLAAESGFQTRPATLAVMTRSLSTFAIEEQQIGKKTFITSKIIIAASPARVWEVLTDYDGAASMFSNVNSCKVLSSSGSTKKVAFAVKTTGNLFKFDYVLAITETSPSLIEWKRASGAFQENEGYWKLEPAQDGKATIVTYAKHIDGGFLFPQVLVKKVVRDSVAGVFADLKHAAESDRLATNVQRVPTE
jgi:uncharacterized membrane protein